MEKEKEEKDREDRGTEERKKKIEELIKKTTGKRKDIILSLIQDVPDDEIASNLGVDVSYVRKTRSMLSRLNLLPESVPEIIFKEKEKLTEEIPPIEGVSPHEVTERMWAHYQTRDKLELAKRLTVLEYELERLRSNPRGEDMEESKESLLSDLKDIIREANRMRLQQEAMKIILGSPNSPENDTVVKRIEALEKKSDLQKLEETFKKEISDIKQSINPRSSVDPALMAKVESLEKLFNTYLANKQIEEIKETVKGTSQQSPIDLFKAFAETQKAVEAERAKSETYRQEAEKARLESLRTTFESQLNQLSQMIGRGKSPTTEELTSLVTTYKKMQEIFGGGTKEKSSGELAKDFIESTLEKIKEPVLAPLGQALAEKARGPQTYGQPVEVQPVEEVKSVAVGGSSNPEEYKDIVQVSKED